MSKSKAIKSAAKATKKATKPAKAPAATKRAKKPAKSAAREDGIFIAPDADDATEATEAPKSAKPAAKPKKATKASAAKPAAAKPTKNKKAAKATPDAKPTKEKKPAAARPDFKPVKLPATFDGGDGSSFTITPEAVTFSRGLREIIFDPRRAHFFPHDVTKAPDGSPLPQPIKAGSVSLIRGQSGIVISADDADAVAAILTAKAAALEAARKSKGGAA